MGCLGITFPGWVATASGAQLEECFGSCSSIWRSTLRKWSEVVFCYLVFYYSLLIIRHQSVLSIDNASYLVACFSQMTALDAPFVFRATFVGVAYGYATIVSSNLAVPMASHVLNNLAGALLWQQTSRSSKQISS